MNYDIGDLLNGWEFNPDEFLARRIRTGKGEEKLQIRIDMGGLQLELSGRPDGQTPHDCPSLLDYYQDLIKKRDEPGDLVLEEEECENLFQLSKQLKSHFNNHILDFNSHWKLKDGLAVMLERFYLWLVRGLVVVLRLTPMYWI